MTDESLNKDMEQLFSRVRQLFKSKSAVSAIVIFLIIMSAFAYRSYTFTKGNLEFGGYPIPTNWDIAIAASLARAFYETGETRYQPLFLTDGGQNYLNPEPVPTPLMEATLAKLLPLPPLQGIFMAQIVALLLIIFVSFALLAQVFDVKTAIIAAAFSAIPSYQYLVHIYYGFYKEILTFLMVLLALWMLVLYSQRRKASFLIIFSLALGLGIINHVIDVVFYLPFLGGLFLHILLKHKSEAKTILKHSLVALVILLVSAALFYQFFHLGYVSYLDNLVGKTGQNFFQVQTLLPEFHNPTLSVPLLIIFSLGIIISLINMGKLSFQKKVFILFSLYIIFLYLLSFPLNKIYLWRQFIGFPLAFVFFGIFITTILNSLSIKEEAKTAIVVVLSIIILVSSFYSYKDTLLRYRTPDDLNQIRWEVADFVSKNTPANATVLKLESEDNSYFFGAYHYYMDRTLYFLPGKSYLSGCAGLPNVTLLEGFYPCQYAGDRGLFYLRQGLFGEKLVERTCKRNMSILSFPVIVMSRYSDENFSKCNAAYDQFLSSNGYKKAFSNQAYVVLQN